MSVVRYDKIKNMDYINIFILLISVTSLVFAWLFYLKNKKNDVLSSFLLLILNATFWSLAMFLYRASSLRESLYFFSVLLYSIPLFLPLAFLNVIRKLKTGYKSISFVIAVFSVLDVLFILAFIALPYGSGGLIQDVYKVSGSVEPVIIFNSHLSWLYSLLISLPFVYGFTILYKEYWKTKNKARKATLFFVGLGVFVPAIISMLSNMILPFMHYYSINWLGQLSVGLAPLFIIYGIYKYKIFNLELFVAEFLVLLLSLQSFAGFLMSDGGVQKTMAFSSLILILVLGTWLLKNIKEEHEARKVLEEKVQELHKTNEHIRALTRKKSEFLSIATHQLRAPLAVMKGQLSMVLEGAYGDIDDKLKVTLKKIFKSMSQMSQTITDFLNVSRIEQGKMRFNMRTIDLNELLKSIYDELKDLADKKSLTFTLEYCNGSDDKLPVYVDSAKLRHVLYNLIENSIKYTEKGFVKISACRDSGKVLIKIQDSGIGIGKDELKTLFDKFIRSKNVYGINVEGSGLGLYIAREVVRAHNGRIWAQSEGVGKGATFTVELPAVEVKEDK